jgi:hypothetical protein
VVWVVVVMVVQQRGVGGGGDGGGSVDGGCRARAVVGRAGTWVVLFMGRTKHNILARPEARHDTVNFGSCRHDTNARVVSCLESRHDERHVTTRILGRAWADTTQKWPICKSVGYSFLIACVICII